MWTLIKFELRKILGNRAGLVACALALGLVSAILLINMLTYGTRDYFTGEYVEGLAAQAANRELVETHVGLLDDAHVAADAAALDAANELIGQTEGFYDMSGEQVIPIMASSSGNRRGASSVSATTWKSLARLIRPIRARPRFRKARLPASTGRSARA